MIGLRRREDRGADIRRIAGGRFLGRAQFERLLPVILPVMPGIRLLREKGAGAAFLGNGEAAAARRGGGCENAIVRCVFFVPLGIVQPAPAQFLARGDRARRGRGVRQFAVRPPFRARGRSGRTHRAAACFGRGMASRQPAGENLAQHAPEHAHGQGDRDARGEAERRPCGIDDGGKAHGLHHRFPEGHGQDEAGQPEQRGKPQGHDLGKMAMRGDRCAGRGHAPAGCTPATLRF